MKKILKRIWTIIKIIMIPFIVLNIMPIIFVVVVYFKGTVGKYEFGYWSPYATGMLLEIVLIVVYLFHKIFSYGSKDF